MSPDVVIDLALVDARVAALADPPKYEVVKDAGREFLRAPASEYIRVLRASLLKATLILCPLDSEVSPDGSLRQRYRLTYVRHGLGYGASREWTVTTPLARYDGKGRRVEPGKAKAWAETWSLVAVAKDLLDLRGHAEDAPDATDLTAPPKAETQEEREAREERVHEARVRARTTPPPRTGETVHCGERPSWMRDTVKPPAEPVDMRALGDEMADALGVTVTSRADLEARLRAEVEQARAQNTDGDGATSPQAPESSSPAPESATPPGDSPGQGASPKRPADMTPDEREAEVERLLAEQRAKPGHKRLVESVKRATRITQADLDVRLGAPGQGASTERDPSWRKPAEGEARCEVRNPGPYGARCRFVAGHAPCPAGVNGHAPELDDVTGPPPRRAVPSPDEAEMAHGFGSPEHRAAVQAKAEARGEPFCPVHGWVLVGDALNEGVAPWCTECTDRRRAGAPEVETPHALDEESGEAPEEPASDRPSGEPALGPTLTEALAARGLTHRPHPGSVRHGHDVLRGEEIGLEDVTAGEVWAWLRDQEEKDREAATWEATAPDEETRRELERLGGVDDLEADDESAAEPWDEEEPMPFASNGDMGRVPETDEDFDELAADVERGGPLTEPTPSQVELVGQVASRVVGGSEALDAAPFEVLVGRAERLRKRKSAKARGDKGPCVLGCRRPVSSGCYWRGDKHEAAHVGCVDMVLGGRDPRTEEVTT